MAKFAKTGTASPISIFFFDLYQFDHWSGHWSVTRPLLGLVASCGSYWQLGSPGQLWPSGPFRAMTQDHPLPNRRDISYQPCSALSCQRCRQLQPPVKLISPSQSRHKSEFNFYQDRKLTSGKCRVRQMLGNIEDLRDFHRRVMLPRMEEAVGDASLMRSRDCHQDCHTNENR